MFTEFRKLWHTSNTYCVFLHLLHITQHFCWRSQIVMHHITNSRHTHILVKIWQWMDTIGTKSESKTHFVVVLPKKRILSDIVPLKSEHNTPNQISRTKIEMSNYTQNTPKAESTMHEMQKKTHEERFMEYRKRVACVSSLFVIVTLFWMWQ